MQNLAKKLLAVQRAITPVEKDGHNAFHHYDYATEAGFLRMLRPLLIENGLVILSEVVGSSIVHVLKNDKGHDMPLTRVQMKFTIIDSDSEETFSGGAEGYGSDAGDKGIYKAMTGATKYFLAKCFQIPTGDDPENEHSKPEKPALRKSMKVAPASPAAPAAPMVLAAPVSAPSGPLCALCGSGRMGERSTPKGPVLACSNYPECKNIQPL